MIYTTRMPEPLNFKLQIVIRRLIPPRSGIQTRICSKTDMFTRRWELVGCKWSWFLRVSSLSWWVQQLNWKYHNKDEVRGRKWCLIYNRRLLFRQRVRTRRCIWDGSDLWYGFKDLFIDYLCSLLWVFCRLYRDLFQNSVISLRSRPNSNWAFFTKTQCSCGSEWFWGKKPLCWWAFISDLAWTTHG